MKTGMRKKLFAILSVIGLLLCAAPIVSVSATDATETNVQLFIRPGRESNYAPLYLSAAESAPSGSDHSTHRYFPLAGEGSITIDGETAPEHYCLNKYGTDGNGGKWILYSTTVNAENLLTVGQTVTVKGKFACSEDPSYVIEFAEVHFKRTAEKAYEQVETAGGSDESGDGNDDTPVTSSGVKLTIRSGRTTSEHLYLSAADTAASTTDYTTQFHPVDGKGAISLDGAPLPDVYLIKYGESSGLGKWVFRMPLDGVNRTMGAGETLTFAGQFQSTLDGTVVDFADVSFRLVAKSDSSYTWSEVSSVEHVKLTLSDIGIANGDYTHVLTSANVDSLEGKELLFNVAHTYDSTAADGEGGRIYIGGTAATPRSGVQLLIRKDNTLNVYAPDGSTRVLKTDLATLSVNSGDRMKWSVSLHYIDSDADGAKDDAAVRLSINGQTVGESELVFPDTALGNTVAFYENTGNTLSLSSVKLENHVSLKDFGLSSGDYGLTATRSGLSDVTLRGTVFEVDMTRYSDTEDDAEDLVFFDYGTTKKGQWDGFRVAVRNDGTLMVHNLLVGTSTYGVCLSSASLSSLGAAMEAKFRLSLKLEMVDQDNDGYRDDALLTVKVNDNEVGAGKNYILDANKIGNGVLIYGTAGDGAALGQVDYVDPDEQVNPFTLAMSEKEESGMNANGDLELFLKPSIGILGNPNEAVYGGLTVTVNGTELTDLAFTKTDFGTFKLVLPAAALPSDSFTVQIAAGVLTRLDGGNVMTLRSDSTLYVSAYGVSATAYIECAGLNVPLTWVSSSTNSQTNPQNGIYLTANDTMPVDTSWATFIYPANEPSSGVFVNGARAAVALKKPANNTYYVCLVDYGYAPQDGDTVLLAGRYELGNQFVEFAPILFKWNASECKWSQVDLSGDTTLPPLTADVIGGPVLLDNVVSINGEAVRSASTALSDVGENTVVYRYGTLEISQQVSLYRAGDIDTDGAYTVLDAVRMLTSNAADSDASRLAMQDGSLGSIRSRVLGETNADKRLPTSTIGQTGAGNYITSVTATKGGTTVFRLSDTADGAVSGGDFNAYGFDYVLDLNADREFKILHLSDPQIIDSAQRRTDDRLGETAVEFWAPDKMDERVLDQIRYLIQTNKPDLVLLTGDLVYGEFDDAGTSFQALIACLEEQKVLWAPVYGNHDNESAKGVAWQSTLLENADYCLFKRRHEIGGNGSYSIGIAQNGELVRTVYMFDSNGCGGTDDTEVTKRVGMTASQIEWYRALALNANTVAGETVPSFMAYHIPTTEFLAAAQAACYQGASDSSNVTYTIGVDNVAQTGDFGTKGEVFKSAWSAGDLHDIMREVGTDGVFVGHSHLNNVSIAYGGVRWTFALKTGEYDRYPTHQGGLLIEVSDGEFALEQVFAN